MGSWADRPRLCFGPHHDFRGHRAAFRSYRSMGSAYPFSLPHPLDVAESASSVRRAANWVLFAKLAKLRDGSPLAFALGENGIRIARILFAIWLVPIGLSHIVYVQATADLVPAWLPFRTGWAYLTGAGQIACGLGVLFSILPRIAAWAEAAMISLFTLLIWAPAIVAAPRTRLPWTAFFISWAIGSAAWAMAQNIVPLRSPRVAALKPQSSEAAD